MLEYEKRTSAVISTAHMSKDDMGLLIEAVRADRALENIIRLSPTALEIIVATEAHRQQIDELASTVAVSDILLDNIGLLFSENDALYSIIFDREAYTVGGLAAFEWE